MKSRKPTKIINNFSIYLNKELKLNKNKKNKDLRKLNFMYS